METYAGIVRRCDHDQHAPHFVEADEPSYYSPPWCHGSPDNWFKWSDKSKLHRGECGNDPAWGLLGYHFYDEVGYVGLRTLATEEDLWAVPVGTCCQVNGQRHAVND